EVLLPGGTRGVSETEMLENQRAIEQRRRELRIEAQRVIGRGQGIWKLRRTIVANRRRETCGSEIVPNCGVCRAVCRSLQRVETFRPSVDQQVGDAYRM